MLGVSTKTIQRYSDQGLLRHGEGVGCYYVWDEVYEWLQARMSQAGDPESDRARKLRCEADLLEMEVKEARGDLLPALEVQEAWRGEVLRCRTKLLAMPNKIGPQLVGQDLPSAVAILSREINEALTELANG